MMYWLRRFFGFFVSRAFWVLVGVFALSLLIWYAGPLFAFAEHRPLESANVRWWLIVGLFALYVLWLIVSFWRRRHVNNLLFDRIGRIKEAVESQRRNPDVSDEVLELQGRFSEAAKTLKALLKAFPKNGERMS